MNRHQLLLLTLITTALLPCPASAQSRKASTLRVSLTDRPDAVLIGDQEIPLDQIQSAAQEAAAATSATVIVLDQGEGGGLEARTALPIVDRLLRTGLPVRANLPRTRGRSRASDKTLLLSDWTADAPASSEICTGGEIPRHGAVSGLVPFLEIDLRCVAALTGEGRSLELRSTARPFIKSTVPGSHGPSATLGLAVGENPRVTDLLLLLKTASGNGYGRVLFLLGDPGSDGVEAAGLLVSLDPNADRPTPLPHRQEPPSASSSPAYRAIRLLAEEALLGMRLEMNSDGSMPEDGEFTAAESTALALMAFLGAGVRAGDGTPSGNAVLAMERWLLAWPPNPNRRYPRRERTIVSTGVIEAYWRTRHPLLAGRAQEGLDELLGEVRTDKEYRDGIEKGFEAIGIVRAAEMGLKRADEATAELQRLLEEFVDPEGGPIKSNYSTRTSVDYIALANALVLLGADSVNDARVVYSSKQTGDELPSINSKLPNEKRALGSFFHARFALNAGGEHQERFIEMLKISLPKAAPASSLNIEEIEPDSVVSPWSGGGSIVSVARVALMAMAYEMPDQWAMKNGGKKGRRNR